MGQAIRVLVVDDEPGIRDFLQLGLQYEGFAVSAAEDGPAALRLVREFDPQVVILDVMLPGMDGWEICRTLRQDPQLIVIFLTAKDEVAERVQGLELGADDYMVKPFSFQELVARIRLRLKRQGLMAPATLHRFKDLELDEETHKVRRGGQEIALSPREFDLLCLFMTNPNRLLTKQQILDRVWGYDFFGDDNVVEVYVRYLRQKLGDKDFGLIQTVRGMGYRMGE